MEEGKMPVERKLDGSITIRTEKGGVCVVGSMVEDNSRSARFKEWLEKCADKVIPCSHTFDETEAFLLRSFDTVPLDPSDRRIRIFLLNIVMNHKEFLQEQPGEFSFDMTDDEMEEWKKKEDLLRQEIMDSEPAKYGLAIRAYRLPQNDLNSAFYARARAHYAAFLRSEVRKGRLKPGDPERMEQTPRQDVCVFFEDRTETIDTREDHSRLKLELIAFRGVTEEDIRQKSIGFLSYAFTLKELGQLPDFEDGRLTLFFPQWQGAGNSKRLYQGAMEIREEFLRQGTYEQVELDCDRDMVLKNGILGYDCIRSQYRNAIKTILERKPQKIFTIGGDCSVELAPVSYLNDLHRGDLTVVWFDAHGDLNTPESSPSGCFHGMPLRTLLGDGDDPIVRDCLSVLKSGQAVLAGCRELDPPEAEYVAENKISVADVGLVSAIDPFIDVIRNKGNRNLYIHIDLDVLDPVDFPNVLCPCRNGISVDQLMKTIRALKEQFNIVGLGLVEYVPGEPGCLEKLKEFIEFGYGL
jgi:arginase